MTIEEIIAEIERKHPLGAYTAIDHFRQDAQIAAIAKAQHKYPDGSVFFDDLISVNGHVTRAGSPVLTTFGTLLVQHKSGGAPIQFDDGVLGFRSVNCNVEILYIAEGQCRFLIEGRDYVFHQGDIILVNRGVEQGRYFHRENSVVLALGISPQFFDRFNHLETTGAEVDVFLRRFVTGVKEKYHFVRFVPKTASSPVPALFEQILSEIWRSLPGSRYIVTGLVQRVLNFLPLEYAADVQGDNAAAARRRLFEEVRRYLEKHYQDVSAERLVQKFGHTIYYFNRLIKQHTGMTCSRFLQDIRLEKARTMLLTTDLPVETIIHEVGYENLGYFYRIFSGKYHKTPREMKNSPPESP